jgi:hypothetical protein
MKMNREAHSLILKMEAVYSSKTSGSLRTTRYNPEYRHRWIHREFNYTNIHYSKEKNFKMRLKKEVRWPKEYHEAFVRKCTGRVTPSRARASTSEIARLTAAAKLLKQLQEFLHDRRGRSKFKRNFQPSARFQHISDSDPFFNSQLFQNGQTFSSPAKNGFLVLTTSSPVSPVTDTTQGHTPN